MKTLFTNYQTYKEGMKKHQWWGSSYVFGLQQYEVTRSTRQARCACTTWGTGRWEVCMPKGNDV